MVRNITKNLCVLTIVLFFSLAYADDGVDESDKFASFHQLSEKDNKNYKSTHITGNIKVSKFAATKITSVSGDTDFNHSKLGSLNVSGSSVLNDCQVDGDVNISGATKLNRTKVKGNVNVSGSLTILSSRLEGKSFKSSGEVTSSHSHYKIPLEISGALTAVEDTFYNPILISGEITADKSIFKKNIIISSVKSSWKHSIINANIINDIDSSHSRNIPTIILEDTDVAGKIIFTKSKGVLILKGNSKVVGSIKNAEVKREH